MGRTASPLDADGVGRPYKPGIKALSAKARRQGQLAGRRGTRSRDDAMEAWAQRNERTELRPYLQAWCAGWELGAAEREAVSDVRSDLG